MADLHESKSSKILRTILSFALFAVLILLSISVCAKSVLLNKNFIEGFFTDYEYTSSVKSSVIEYTSDIYQRNGLDTDNLDKIFSDKLIKETVKAYISSSTGLGAEYNENTYTEEINAICKSVGDDVKKQVREKHLNNNDNAVEEIENTVNEYFTNEIDIGVSNVRNMLNMAKIATIAVLCISLFFAVSIALILFYIGSKRYRSIRAVGISFYTAGLFDMFFALTATVIFSIKRIDIFPIYLRELVMNYIHYGICSVAFAGFFMLFAGLLMSFAVWKIRKGKAQR